MDTIAFPSGLASCALLVLPPGCWFTRLFKRHKFAKSLMPPQLNLHDMISIGSTEG
jgi:hypothetical protein